MELISKCPNCGDDINPLIGGFSVKMEIFDELVVNGICCDDDCATEWIDAEIKKKPLARSIKCSLE